MTDDLAFDHALIMHDDLGVAAAALARLGFRPTPLGYHGDALGTENVTVVLPDRQTYFEVLAVRRETPKNVVRREALKARSRHLFGTALKGDAHAIYARLSAKGIPQIPPFDFQRAVDLPSGPRDAAFTVAHFKAETLPGLQSFVCQHHTPEVVWREDYVVQPNGAQAVTGLWGVAPDPAALGEVWSRLYGRALGGDAHRLTVETGTARVNYLAPSVWAQTFPSLAVPDTSGPRLWALEFAVADLGATAAHLQGANVPFEREGERLAVPDQIGMGAAFVFRS